MALIISGKKGWMAISDMYTMLGSVTVQKRMSGELGNNVPVIAISVQVNMYENQQQRMTNFISPALQEYFTFTPPNNTDYPVAAAYEHIKANGIPGWVINSKVDV